MEESELMCRRPALGRQLGSVIVLKAFHCLSFALSRTWGCAARKYIPSDAVFQCCSQTYTPAHTLFWALLQHHFTLTH